jgi:hypothetical protein
MRIRPVCSTTNVEDDSVGRQARSRGLSRPSRTGSTVSCGGAPAAADVVVLVAGDGAVDVGGPDACGALDGAGVTDRSPQAARKRATDIQQTIRRRMRPGC